MKLESGSSPYFCILAVVFPDLFSADACERAIIGHRREMKRSPGYEFHFTNSANFARTAFLQCVAQEQFSYDAFVIDKKRLYSPKFNDAKHFYEFAAKLVCDNAGSVMTNAKVVIDKNGDRAFLKRLQTSLKLLTGANGSQIVKKVTMQDSKSNDLVQLADMVCGAVARSITAGDFGFRELLKRKGRERRVQCWP